MKKRTEKLFVKIGPVEYYSTPCFVSTARNNGHMCRVSIWQDLRSKYTGFIENGHIKEFSDGHEYDVPKKNTIVFYTGESYAEAKRKGLNLISKVDCCFVNKQEKPNYRWTKDKESPDFIKNPFNFWSFFVDKKRRWDIIKEERFVKKNVWETEFR